MDQQPAQVSNGPQHAASRVQRSWKAAIGYVVAAACLVWVFHDVRFDELFRDIEAMNWWLVALAVGFDILSYLCQGWRWSLLLHPKGRLSVLRTTQAVYAGLFVNEILPMRIGEVLRIYLASRWLTVDFTTIVSSVLVERLFDAIWLALAAAVTILIVPLPRYLMDAEKLLAVIVLAALALFVYLVMKKRPVLPAEISRHGFRSGLLRITGNLSSGIRDIGRSRYMYESLGVSGLFLIFQVLAFWLVMWAYGLRLSFWQGTVVVLILHLGTMIPSAPSNIGTYQFFTVVGLTQFGVEKTTATGFSVVVFLILTIPLWILGIFAFGRAGLTMRQLRTDLPRWGKRRGEEVASS